MFFFRTACRTCRDRALCFKYFAVFCYSYFQKVPAEAPQLELKANYGLVEPVPFEFPALNAHWTPETLAAFDLTKRPKDDTVRQSYVLFSPISFIQCIIQSYCFPFCNIPQLSAGCRQRLPPRLKSLLCQEASQSTSATLSVSQIRSNFLLSPK